MNYPLFLARRLSLATKQGKKSPAVAVAIIAVAVAVAVMIASVAIVLGFKQEIRNKIVGFNGHITIYKIQKNDEDDNLLTFSSDLKETLDSLKFITDYSITAAIPAILKTPEEFKGVYLKGLQGATTHEYINENLEEGIIPDFSIDSLKNQIIISRITANKLGLGTGDKIDTYFMSDDIRVRRLEVAGIYNSHFDQYDDVLIFGSIGLVAQMGGIPEDTGTYLTVTTDNFDKIEEYTFLLQDALNRKALNGETDTFYRADNVLTQGKGYFSWLSLLDTNVAVIIILMIVVGCVTLVSGMLIIILERKKFIGLMRSIGADTAHIRNVFIYMAIKIAFIGIIIGDIAILILLYFQERFHFLHLDPDSYYIDFVPVFIPAYVILALNAGVIVVTYLVLVLPSRFVGKISPVESMAGE